MYIAVTHKKGSTHYQLRHSCEVNNRLGYLNLFDLGSNPARFIKYPGGNAFYIDEAIEDALTSLGIEYDTDELEDLFWHWLDPEIKYAVRHFRNRSDRIKNRSAHDYEGLTTDIQPFDKRRMHFLKFGSMDQGPVANMPPALFKDLAYQSRDEIEQGFLRQESILKPHEVKSYVYTIFDLQSFFSSFMAKKMPHVLDQKKVEAHLLEEICRVNSLLFNKKNELDGYLKRYLIMFFDYQYADTTLLDDLAKDFMFRHHFYTPKPPPNIPVRNALKIFKLTQKEFRQMDKKELTQHYRNLARNCHPDVGGSHDACVELNTAYESLLERISKN
jgi:hypothetical protein